MQWIEASFRTRSEDIDALCEKLAALGADGLVIEDEADFRRFLEENRQYWDYVDEELEARYRGVSRVKLYVEDSPEGRSRLAAFTDGTGLEPECRVVADEDWAENWKQYYKPIEIGEKLLILPRWEPIPENPGRLILRLDPGLAFGTGGHATTRMCLEALEKYAGDVYKRQMLSSAPTSTRARTASSGASPPCRASNGQRRSFPSCPRAARWKSSGRSSFPALAPSRATRRRIGGCTTLSSRPARTGSTPWA